MGAVFSRLVDSLEVAETRQIGDLKVAFFTSKQWETDGFLLSEGGVLVGGRQKRVLSTSMFTGARDKTRVPAGRVERRRWHRAWDFLKALHKAKEERRNSAGEGHDVLKAIQSWGLLLRSEMRFCTPPLLPEGKPPSRSRGGGDPFEEMDVCVLLRFSLLLYSAKKAET